MTMSYFISQYHTSVKKEDFNDMFTKKVGECKYLFEQIVKVYSHLCESDERRYLRDKVELQGLARGWIGRRK